jgi:hypothetical protein
MLTYNDIYVILICSSFKIKKEEYTEMDIKKIERLLESGDVKEVQKGVGYAALALLKELQENRSVTTLNKRPPVKGDVITMFCDHVCDRNTQHAFQTVTDLNDRIMIARWVCCGCNHEIDV